MSVFKYFKSRLNVANRLRVLFFSCEILKIRKKKTRNYTNVFIYYMLQRTDWPMLNQLRSIDGLIKLTYLLKFTYDFFFRDIIDENYWHLNLRGFVAMIFENFFLFFFFVCNFPKNCSIVTRRGARPEKKIFSNRFDRGGEKSFTSFFFSLLIKM